MAASLKRRRSVEDALLLLIHVVASRGDLSAEELIKHRDAEAEKLVGEVRGLVDGNWKRLERRRHDLRAANLRDLLSQFVKAWKGKEPSVEAKESLRSELKKILDWKSDVEIENHVKVTANQVKRYKPGPKDRLAAELAGTFLANVDPRQLQNLIRAAKQVPLVPIAYQTTFSRSRLIEYIVRLAGCSALVAREFRVLLDRASFVGAEDREDALVGVLRDGQHRLNEKARS